MLEITTAFSGLTSALQVLRTAVAARDAGKIDAAMQDMTERLSGALMSALAATEAARSLQAALIAAERKNGELEEKIADRAMYELHELRAGAFAYRSKPALEGEQHPLHYLCQPCYDKGVKSVLRTEPALGYGTIWVCPAEEPHAIN